MKKGKLLLTAVMVCCLVWLTSCTGSLAKKSGLDPKNPVTVTVWHYYNGAQQQAFNALVSEFNDTTGKEMGVVVESVGQGSVTNLETNVLASAEQKVGAAQMPNIFSAYADTAYTIDQKGLVEDLSAYLTDADQKKYVDSYWDEGRLTGEQSLKIFPIAKSIELLVINQTDWEKFASANGIPADKLAGATIEDVTALAAQYYNWTDSLTSQPEDGKALFGRDAIANYMLIGAKQLGVELFAVKDNQVTLNFDRDVVRKLWDNYYVPYINGYFAAAGRFRSDDVKSGTVAAFVGSSSGATFFPDEVIVNDQERYNINMQVYQSPMFAGAQKFAVQQGAGMVVTKNEDPRKIYGSVEFLKWFTSEERNMNFSISSGYVPVVKSAYNKIFLKENTQIDSDMSNIITNAIDTVNAAQLYTPKAFAGGTSARNVLEKAMSDQAKTDRAQVLDKMAGGMPRGEAVALFNTDVQFNTWYEQTKNALEAVLQS